MPSAINTDTSAMRSDALCARSQFVVSIREGRVSGVLGAVTGARGQAFMQFPSASLRGEADNRKVCGNDEPFTVSRG